MTVCEWIIYLVFLIVVNTTAIIITVNKSKHDASKLLNQSKQPKIKPDAKVKELSEWIFENALYVHKIETTSSHKGYTVNFNVEVQRKRSESQ